jgi:hypothetical protein
MEVGGVQLIEYTLVNDSWIKQTVIQERSIAENNKIERISRASAGILASYWVT